MKTILCYGDSNTWGQIPLKEFAKKRHPFEVRWPGKMQILSIDRYRVIEEGLNGRTTGPEDPMRQGRNGRSYLDACLDSHVPLDLVIFMLGTNDLKRKFNPNPLTICQRMQEIVRATKSLCAASPSVATEILLMAPVIPKRDYIYEDFHYSELETFAKHLVQLYADMARDEGVHFLDASRHMEASVLDGAHLEANVHQAFARVVLEKMDEIFSKGAR